jgi:hypothetical protein
MSPSTNAADARRDARRLDNRRVCAVQHPAGFGKGDDSLASGAAQLTAVLGEQLCEHLGFALVELRWLSWCVVVDQFDGGCAATAS